MVSWHSKERNLLTQYIIWEFDTHFLREEHNFVTNPTKSNYQTIKIEKKDELFFHESLYQVRKKLHAGVAWQLLSGRPLTQRISSNNETGLYRLSVWTGAVCQACGSGMTAVGASSVERRQRRLSWEIWDHAQWLVSTFLIKIQLIKIIKNILGIMIYKTISFLIMKSLLQRKNSSVSSV